MLNLETAIELLQRKFPDKKMIGNPAEYKGKYTFSMVSRDYVEGTPNWDSTIIAIDKSTGKISQFNAFSDPDFLTEAKPIQRES